MSHTIVGVSPRNPMWVFEENYRLLLRILPGIPALGEQLTLVSERAGGELNLSVLELSRYTSTMEFAKPFSGDQDLLPAIRLKVRAYHDAAVVEVLGYQGCDRIPARYQIAGPGKFHRDEKNQVNYLLNDLLRHCLRYDYRAVSDITRA